MISEKNGFEKTKAEHYKSSYYPYVIKKFINNEYKIAYKYFSFGCSNIEKFYNIEGIILFRSVDELIKICNNLTSEYYDSRLKVIEENYKKVNQYQKYENRICSKIIDILKYNNII